MTDEQEVKANEGATEVSFPAKGRIHRVDRKYFIAQVKEYTRPGRPAFAALARSLGLTLVDFRKCALDTCGKVFYPVTQLQQHCCKAHANRTRQKRFEAKLKAATHMEVAREASGE